MVSRVAVHVLFLFLNFLVLLVAGLALAFRVFLRQRVSSLAGSALPPGGITLILRIHLKSGLILFTKASAIVD